MENKNGENNGINKNEGTAEAKKTLKQRGHEFAAKHPKPIKWAKRIGAAAGFIGSAVAGFVAGKRSVKPTYVTVTPIEPEKEPEPVEEPTEESVEE